VANTTGDQPMTNGPYLETLKHVPGTSLREDINHVKNSEATVRIDELQRKTGRGLDDDA
jgi:Protein of unknown function (DUF3072)